MPANNTAKQTQQIECQKCNITFSVPKRFPLPLCISIKKYFSNASLI